MASRRSTAPASPRSCASPSRWRAKAACSAWSAARVASATPSPSPASSKPSPPSNPNPPPSPTSDSSSPITDPANPVLNSRFMVGRNLFHRALYAAVSFILFLSGDLTSFSQETSRAALPETEIRAFANRILQKTGKVDCKPGNCTILVANFTLPSGATSRLGMQIADQVSKELASQQNAIKIVDRSRLQTFLDEERIPAALFNNEKAICWMGKQMGATTLLRGTTENRGGPLRVQASLLSCAKDKAGPIEEFA